jgi:hypothetical protein
LLSGLQRVLLEDSALESAVSKVSKALRLAESNETGSLLELNAKRTEIEREMKNLTDAICKSGGSEFLLKTIQAKEAQLKSVVENLHRHAQDSTASFDPEELWTTVLKELSDLAGLLNADPVRAKAELLRHVSEIRMVPTEADGNRFYVAEGEWNMLPEMKTGSQLFDSEENPYFRMVAGAGFEPATFGL